MSNIDLSHNSKSYRVDPELAILTKYIATPISSESRLAEIMDFEARWHVQVSYFCELIGSEAISEMLVLAPSHKASKILSTHMKDEDRHAKLYSKVVHDWEKYDGAKSFARGYLDAMNNEPTFCGKVFITQVLIEAAAASYALWRTSVIKDDDINKIDFEVSEDEARHLTFAIPLLSECPISQVKEELSAQKRVELKKKILNVSLQATKFDLFQEAKNLFNIDFKPLKRDELATGVSSQISHESRKIVEFLRASDS